LSKTVAAKVTDFSWNTEVGDAEPTVGAVVSGGVVVVVDVVVVLLVVVLVLVVVVAFGSVVVVLVVVVAFGSVVVVVVVGTVVVVSLVSFTAKTADGRVAADTRT